MDELDEIKRVEDSADLLFCSRQVEEAIDAMAQSIIAALGESNPVVLCVLNGGIIATAKLLQRLPFPLSVDSIHATRYRGETRGGQVEWLKWPSTSLRGRTVLITDDILDEGYTLAAIKDYCQEQGASKVFSAVLVDKQLEKEKPVGADFVALRVENRYLFGYGMDYKGYLRNAHGIYACSDYKTGSAA